MKFYMETPWQGHLVILCHVKKWRQWYRFINMVCARADRPIEFVVDDGTLVRMGGKHHG